MEFHYADGGFHWIDATNEGGYQEAVQLMAAWPGRRADTRTVIEADNGAQQIELTDVVRLKLEVTA